MDVYLAEKNYYNTIMDIYLAGLDGRGNYLIDPKENKKMDLYLAGEYTCKNGSLANWNNLKILESFYYVKRNTYFPKLIQSNVKIILDSGAFTFISAQKGTVDWEEYIKNYAAFINQYDIKNFFELDIDPIVGLKEVEQLRNTLERLTGKKPIPVWHKNRGKDYFVWMCQNYPYVALGGIVTKEIPTEKYELMFPWFIKTAHSYGCKIHGLGYTHLQNLKNYKFDSVDSTAWLYGNMGGYAYKFNPIKGTVEKITKKQGQKLNSKVVAIHNFNEWVRFQQYADKFL